VRPASSIPPSSTEDRPKPAPDSRERSDGSGSERSESFWNDFFSRFLRGDHGAFVQITRIIMASISRMGAFELRDSWADIAQDVLMVVLENARSGTLREPKAFVAYTQTITRRRVLAWLEHHGRLPANWATSSSIAVDPEAFCVDADLKVDLERALSELPPSCRRVVEETYLHGRTYQEAATELGLSLRQVKRLQSRALARLRVSLGAD